MGITIHVREMVALQCFVSMLLPTLVSLSIPTCEDQCLCDPPSVMCQGTVPRQLPPNVTMVTVKSFLSLRDQEHPIVMNFSHVSYAGVRSLYINPNYEASEEGNQHIFTGLGDDTFTGLSSLDHLQYASLNLKRLSTFTFRGLEKLKSLDLSNNVNLPGSEVAKALSNETVLAELEELKLSNIQVNLQLGDFDSRAALMSLRPISALDLSRLKLEVGEEGVLSAFPNLRELNLSTSTIAVTSPNKAFFSIAAPNITTIDLSSTNFLALIQTFMNLFKFLEHFVVLPFEFRYRELYVNSANDDGWPIHVGIDTMVRDGIRTCLTLTFDQSGFRPHLNMCFEKSDAAHLEVFSARQNKLRAFSVDVFKFFPSLRIVDLSRNELGYMQRNNLSEFGNLFSMNANLSKLDLSANDITHLPSCIFNQNDKLQRLDLSKNGLYSIDIDLSNLVDLKFLDLSYNKFKVLDQQSINVLSAFEAYVSKRNVTTDVSLFGNPFECTCEAKNTVTWFIKTNLVKTDSLCIYDGTQQTFTQHLLSDVEYLCVKNTITILVSISSISVCIVVALASVYMFKKVSKRRKMKHKEDLIRLYQDKERPRKYAVFLSYSSLDVDFVMTRVYKQLNTKLQEILDTDDDCVATGDTHFIPGLQLADEIIKCIDQSSVVVLFMTRNFCNSPWCKDEAMAAHYDRKPIILMFGEHVDTGYMPKPLQRHLQVYSRVFWKKEEGGEWILKPDWTKLSEAIIAFVDIKMLAV